MELTIEKVKGLLEEAGNSSWEVIEDGCIWTVTAPYANITTDADKNCAALIAAAPDLARLAISLSERLAAAEARIEEVKCLADQFEHWGNDTGSHKQWSDCRRNSAALIRSALAPEVAR